MTGIPIPFTSVCQFHHKAINHSWLYSILQFTFLSFIQFQQNIIRKIFSWFSPPFCHFPIPYLPSFRMIDSNTVSLVFLSHSARGRTRTDSIPYWRGDNYFWGSPLCQFAYTGILSVALVGVEPTKSFVFETNRFAKICVQGHKWIRRRSNSHLRFFRPTLLHFSYWSIFAQRIMKRIGTKLCWPTFFKM